MKKSELSFIFKAFAFWLIGLFAILTIAVKFVPVQKDFLGGGSGNYSRNPYLWSWGNFDGEHYVSIAKNGYGYGEHAFFPVYPTLIKTLAASFGGTLSSYYVSGVLISLVSFLAGIIGFYKLLRLDFPEKISKFAILFLLLFPTSFYFAAVYTESLFFALSVWSFYFVRKKRWFSATFLGIVLTATRFVGIIILPALVIEWYLSTGKKKIAWSKFPIDLVAIPTGLLSYMYILETTIHNKFAFYSELTAFGEQRSARPILLPQVFYRYIFKIFPNLNTTFLPVIFTTTLEVLTGTLFLIASVWSFFKLRVSYAILLTLGYLVPTLSGSFSSLPRYVLVLFPIYILASVTIKRKPLLFAILGFSFILLLASFTLFARGYWLS